MQQASHPRRTRHNPIRKAASMHRCLPCSSHGPAPQGQVLNQTHTIKHDSSHSTPYYHAVALDVPASNGSVAFPDGPSLGNMLYTLFCPFAARVMFENWASDSLLPALRLSRTLRKPRVSRMDLQSNAPSRQAG